jgi:hypothetical protein
MRVIQEPITDACSSLELNFAYNNLLIKAVHSMLLDIYISAEYPCPYEPVDGNNAQYKVIQTWDIVNCSDGTVFSVEDCACVHGYAGQC